MPRKHVLIICTSAWLLQLPYNSIISTFTPSSPRLFYFDKNKANLVMTEFLLLRVTCRRESDSIVTFLIIGEIKRPLQKIYLSFSIYFIGKQMKMEIKEQWEFLQIIGNFLSFSRVDLYVDYKLYLLQKKQEKKPRNKSFGI